MPLPVELPKGPAPYLNRLSPPVDIKAPAQMMQQLPDSYRFPPIDPATFVPNDYRLPVTSTGQKHQIANVKNISNDGNQHKQQSSIYIPAQIRNFEQERLQFVPSAVAVVGKVASKAPTEVKEVAPAADKEIAAVTAQEDFLTVDTNVNTVHQLDEEEGNEDEDPLVHVIKKPRIEIDLFKGRRDRLNETYEEFKRGFM